MKSIFILFLFVCVILYPVHAQEESTYSESMSEINDYLLSGEYADALPLLLELEKKGFTKGNVEYKIGYCYLNTAGEEQKSISFFQRATDDIAPDYKNTNLDEKQAPLETYLSLGDAFRLTNQFDTAKKYYDIYASRLKPTDEKSKAIVQKRIIECLFAKVMVKRPIKATFVNMGQSVNSGLANFNGCISGDGKSLVFIRRKKFYDAVYFCTRDSNGWSEPEEITTKLGSDGEFYPTSLSYDGTHMLLESYGFLTGEDIYESNMVGGKWGKVKKLEFQVSSKYNDEDAVYAPDGKTIYFSSNRESGMGGYDIYKSTRDAFGHWSYVENLGAPVNTPFDERSPSVCDNGKILVFSSNSEPNMGGYDFFYALRDSLSGKYTNVYNVGYPINTSGDDLGLTLENTPGLGVISKYAKDGFTGNDLFWVHYSDFSKFHIIPVNGVITVNGQQLKSPQDYSLAFVDESINDTVQLVSLDENGAYQANLYPGDFLLKIKGRDMENQRELNVPQEIKNDNFLVSADLKVNKPEPKEKEALAVTVHDTCYLTDIHFAFNQFRIEGKEIELLSGIASKLKHYSISRIIILGYTDALGNKEYNRRLSALRAMEVKKYLQEHGFDGNILFPEGDGETNFVAINKNANGTDNLRGRAYNRRVELKVISDSQKVLFIRKNDVPEDLQVKP